MKFLLDFLPIAIFFVAYELSDIYTATAVAIAATIVQIALLRWKTGKVEPMQWFSLAVIVVFGGATIVLHNPTFIKWKPSILYWSFAAVLAFGQLVLRKNLLRLALGSQVQLPDTAWRAMTWSWFGFFLVAGALNLWVAFNYSEAVWVKFKVFGLLSLMVVFVIAQALWMARLVKDDEPGTDRP
ncbi:septation protein A [Ramlibacter algicola]|uniref:Inner membrane-spanning protein YciB n=1 Tax=Ramlibacter algicola TaxID=2795217 RepID=A0A934US00_9BURK|nr:septation protein A [Ramlibacter algicola]